MNVRCVVDPARSSSVPRYLGFVSSFLIFLALLFTVAQSASAVTLGLNWSGSYWEGESASEMDVVQHSGAKVFRQQISWGYKKANGWKPYDEVFGHAAERGITILPYLYGRADGSPQFPTEGEFAAWENWVYEVVNRYGYGGDFWAGKPYARPVDVWEVWNEENLAWNNPGGSSVQPENYGRFLKRTSAALKAAQQARAPGHGVTVIVGGLMKVPSGKGNIQTFLEGINKVSGATASYDALGLHPYQFESTNHITELNGTLSFARWVLDNIVPSKGKPIWVTELGWPIGNESPSKKYVNEAEQATLLTQAFDLIKAHAAEYNIPTAIWYAYRDIPVNEWSYVCGLRRTDGAYRPSWWAYQEEAGAEKWPVKPATEFTAFQANNGELWYRSSITGLGVPTGAGMATATSPSIAAKPSGDYIIAFQNWKNELWTHSTATGGSATTGMGMSAGTSPSIATKPDGSYLVAFQDWQHNLWIYSSATGGFNTTLGMLAGTSPSIVYNPDGTYVVAFQANNGELWYYYSATGLGVPTKAGMAAGTSPSIAYVPGTGDVIAFQDWQKNLWRYSTASGTAFNTTLGLAGGTNPSIVGNPNGTYVIAFQANNNTLWYYYSASGLGAPTGAGMASGTSPSIAYVPGVGNTIAFQDWQKNLWQYFTVSGTAFNTTLGMLVGTSPSAAAG